MSPSVFITAMQRILVNLKQLGCVMNAELFFGEALCLPTNGIDYLVSQRLQSAFPQKALVQGRDHIFDVEEYAQTQQCTITHKSTVYSQVLTHWKGARKEAA